MKEVERVQAGRRLGGRVRLMGQGGGVEALPTPYELWLRQEVSRAQEGAETHNSKEISK